MLFSYSYGQWRNWQWETKHLFRRPFCWPCGCIRAMVMASLDVGCPGLLLRKPLDATIGQLLITYYPGCRQGDIQQKDEENTLNSLAISMAIAMRWYYTVRIAQWKRSRAFLKATKRQHRASTCSDIINRTYLTQILGIYFIVKLLKKGSSCPNNNRGMTHQSDEKHLNKTIGHLVGWLI